ncbi:TonB-dependent receptor [Pedobacter sp. ASV28]|uniref:TonB-dependent receptor n=1 Tax=Pedobacter sp. ASV28 TaxID=2795123 RepID=UPI0018ED0BA6|nr:TonB-dependent receptor [Pedobacter sp. ASV28]
MKIRLLFQITPVLLLFSFMALAQQNGSIKGQITTADGKPAAYVNIGLKNRSQSTSTNEGGFYTLSKIKAGTYVLRVSAVGINTQEKGITISAGQTLELNFILTENSQALKEVSIQAKKNTHKISTPDNSSRLNEPLLEAAQNIQSVSNQTIKDQQIISMSDGLIRNVSGAVRLEHWGDMYTNIQMRGSQIQAMRNGFNVVSSYWGPLTEDMSFVDHIEFIKGPAGFLMGSGDPSGMYNVVTKKPTGLDKGEVSFSLGSYDFYRTTIDLDRKITNDGKLLFRLNAAAQQKASFRPYEHNDRYSIAPVISYQFTPQTKFTAEYTLQRAQMTEVGSYYIFSPQGYANLPREFTFTQPGLDPTNINDHSVFLNLVHQFSDTWKVTAQAAYFKYLQTGTSTWPAFVYPNGNVIRNAGIWDAESTMKLAQVFLNGEAKTGGLRHRILIGLDGGKKDYMADWGQSHNLDDVSAPFNVYSPNYGFPSNGYPNFDRITSLTERAKTAGGLMDQKYLSVYMQDELGFFQNKLRLTLAARYAYLSQSAWGGSPDKAKRITPRLGLSYSINNSTAAYAVYDQAFIPQSGLLRDGSSIKPITGSNMEVGLKKDWADGKWNTTLAAYRITKQNELTTDPANKAGEMFSIVVGEKRAEGIEFDLKGEMAKGLVLIANYAFTDGKVTKAIANGPINVGDAVPGFAKHTSNAWLSYTLQSGWLKGTGLNAGVTHLAGRAVQNYSRTNPEQNLPNYLKVDAGLSWERGPIKITGNVFNVLDEYLYNGAYYTGYFNAPTYDQGTYSWQAEAPRNYRFSIAYKF